MSGRQPVPEGGRCIWQESSAQGTPAASLSVATQTDSWLELSCCCVQCAADSDTWRPQEDQGDRAPTPNVTYEWQDVRCDGGEASEYDNVPNTPEVLPFFMHSSILDTEYEMDPEGLAALDGRIREGDQILQINGNDVTSLQQTEQVLAQSLESVTFLLSRPADEPIHLYDAYDDSSLLEDQLGILEEMQELCISEDDTVCLDHSHPSEKDSGVGNTDTTRTEESSDQDLHEYETIYDIQQALQRSPSGSSPRHISKTSERPKDLHGLPQNEYSTAKWTNNPLSPRRQYPRMGAGSFGDNSPQKSPERTIPNGYQASETRTNNQIERHHSSNSSSAYNSGESGRSSPLQTEVSSNVPTQTFPRDESSQTLCNSTAGLSSDTDKVSTPVEKHAASDHRNTDGCFYIGTPSPSPHVHPQLCHAQTPCQENRPAFMQKQMHSESPEIVYTTSADLQQTMAVQQRLFQQSLIYHAKEKQASRGHGQRTPEERHLHFGSPNMPPSPHTPRPSPSGSQVFYQPEMEWVVKRRADGSRYITRRPVRSRILRERAKKLEEQRRGVTTDEDAMSEVKQGRYWPREQRRHHLARARDSRRKKEMQQERMEREECRTPTIVNMSRRKVEKHRQRSAYDDFKVFQEMLANGMHSPSQAYYPVLSVTTV